MAGGGGGRTACPAVFAAQVSNTGALGETPAEEGSGYGAAGPGVQMLLKLRSGPGPSAMGEGWPVKKPEVRASVRG